MLKEERLVEWNNEYFKIDSIHKDHVCLKVNNNLISVLNSDVKEITNDNIEWSKVPIGTPIYYYNDTYKEYFKYSFIFIKSFVDKDTDKLHIRYKFEDTNHEFQSYFTQVYILDDWLEKQISSHFYEAEEEGHFYNAKHFHYK
jgi:hypothetical protein